jgi:hypothetical protein
VLVYHKWNQTFFIFGNSKFCEIACEDFQLFDDY